MAGLPGLMGLGGGAAGSGFAGPQSAGIVNPVTPEQMTQAYDASQNSLTAQNKLLTAIQAQNGLGNQSQVYGQLQGVVNGTGPNPAQAMLNQATGQNVANQAALMAGQRGASSNVGLMARQAAQQGAQTQQQSLGQAATLQANQSLNALGAAGNMANTQATNQIGQTNANASARLAEQQALMGANAQYNAANVGMQSNVNNVNGQLANTQMQGQQAMIGGLMNGLSGAAGGGGGAGGAGAAGAAMAKGGMVRHYDDGGDVGSYDTSTPTFGADAGAAALGPQKSSGGGGGGGGLLSKLPMLAMAAAEGGDVPNMGIAPPGPQSSFGQFILGPQPDATVPNVSTPSFGDDAGAKALKQGTQNLASKKDAAPQGQTTAGPDTPQSSPTMPEEGTMMAARGGGVKDFRVGGKVKADGEKQKASAKGNSYSNDKIPAILSEHEIVLPRSVTMSSDPVNGAAKFVQAILAKRKSGK